MKNLFLEDEFKHFFLRFYWDVCLFTLVNNNGGCGFHFAITLRTVHDSIILGTANFITATAGDANTDAATAGGVSTEIADADKATVRLTTVARIAADWAKTKTVSTDSILFCEFFVHLNVNTIYYINIT